MTLRETDRASETSSEQFCFGMNLFCSHRSAVFGRRGCVASSQPLATEIGVRVLQRGGNAADAAVAVAAALNVTEPTSTGIGGDSFCLFYDARRRRVCGLNGSGRAPGLLSVAKLRSELGLAAGADSLPPYSVHCVTVPGAAACWCDTIELFGRLTIGEVLAPAIELAETGFPVSPLTAMSWQAGAAQLRNSANGDEMLLDGRPPRVAEVMRLPMLARTLREIGAHGKRGFYEGRIARAIVEVIESLGGCMRLEDLQGHSSTMDEPIRVNYRGVDIWEMPPNGQGITALMALNLLEGFDLASLPHNSPDHLHLVIESLRLAFADTRWYVADPTRAMVPVRELLSRRYAESRRQLVDPQRASVDVQRGSPTGGSDTVYFCVVDGDGNACSFINSNYMGFGTGIIPKECGFTLQNRGANFSLLDGHPNMLEGGKRPYHTIIPGMATVNDELWAAFGVQGGFMQPQGHVQVLLNMIDFGMEPQTALDCPRVALLDGRSNGKILFEDGIPEQTIASLQSMGHSVQTTRITGCYERAMFGRGQIIRKMADSGVLWAGSDPRADGLALGWC